MELISLGSKKDLQLHKCIDVIFQPITHEHIVNQLQWINAILGDHINSYFMAVEKLFSLKWRIFSVRWHYYYMKTPLSKCSLNPFLVDLSNCYWQECRLYYREGPCFVNTFIVKLHFWVALPILSVKMNIGTTILCCSSFPLHGTFWSISESTFAYLVHGQRLSEKQKV